MEKINENKEYTKLVILNIEDIFDGQIEARMV